MIYRYWSKRCLVCISLLWFGLIIITHDLNAQDPHFSQYYASPLYLNPAMTGMERDLYFGMNYRTQWQSLDFPYKTYQFSMIHPVFTQGSEKNQIGGLGFTIYKDQAGEGNVFTTIRHNRFSRV